MPVGPHTAACSSRKQLRFVATVRCYLDEPALHLDRGIPIVDADFEARTPADQSQPRGPNVEPAARLGTDQIVGATLSLHDFGLFAGYRQRQDAVRPDP